MDAKVTDLTWNVETAFGLYPEWQTREPVLH